MKKVLLVTGAGRGIGAATARLAAARGYSVCLNFRRDRAAAEAVLRDIEAAGGSALTVAADISVEAEVLRLFETIDSELGPLTALVNNAGILETQSRLQDMEASRFERIFGTNVIGAFLCAREAIKRMSFEYGGAGGAIVNVSSVAARLGAAGEYVDYAASKGALDTMTLGLAQELGPQGIRVNAVRPGYIYTEMHASGGEPGRVDRVKSGVPLRRGGTAEEVAEAILWLLSEQASYSSGSFIELAGGR